jgi:lipoprotein-releasing system permease protein
MKSVNWIFFTAFRYLRARKADRMLGPSVLAVAGIAIGVMALVSVLGVMNGFQVGFIEDIININSFHIRAYSNKLELDIETLNMLRSIDGVESVLPFVDIQTLIKGDYSGFEAVNIRLIPGDIKDYDPAMAEQLNIKGGNLNLEHNKFILLGSQLASHLGVGKNDDISLISMEGSNFRSLSPSESVFTLSGLFQSGYYSFDRSMGFTNLSNSDLLTSGKEKLVYGIKLKDQYKDKNIALIIKEKLGMNYDVQSWRDFNSSFFGALRTEKTAMMLVIGLIFIVVAVNIKHSLERSVIEKKEEIGVLMSLGATPISIRTVFIIEGFIIGFLGASIGLISGLFITSNINSLFTGLDFIVGFIEDIAQFIISPFTTKYLDLSSIISINNFYISEVPVKIVFSEILFVFLFAVISSTWAAYSASRIISMYKPAEVLRYE